MTELDVEKLKRLNAEYEEAVDPQRGPAWWHLEQEFMRQKDLILAALEDRDRLRAAVVGLFDEVPGEQFCPRCGITLSRLADLAAARHAALEGRDG